MFAQMTETKCDWKTDCHKQLNLTSRYLHTYVISILHDFLSSVEHEIFWETFQNSIYFLPYIGSHWWPKRLVKFLLLCSTEESQSPRFLDDCPFNYKWGSRGLIVKSLTWNPKVRVLGTAGIIDEGENIKEFYFCSYY